MKQTLNPVVAKVVKRLHYPLDVILLCPLVQRVSVESSRSGRNDGRAGDLCRSVDRAALGDQIERCRSYPCRKAHDRGNESEGEGPTAFPFSLSIAFQLPVLVLIDARIGRDPPLTHCRIHQQSEIPTTRVRRHICLHEQGEIIESQKQR